MTWLGLQAGRVFLLPKQKQRQQLQGVSVRAVHHSMLTRWSVWAVLLGALGGGLSSFSKNDGIVPLNKNLWSPSFVLGIAALSFVVLAIFYVAVDMLHTWSGAPFRYPGMNSVCDEPLL
jgi:predicted acyltransferase